ncbi:MAG: amidophosphoribosyltransferase [Planctomycetes bacterium]|nr:amidophosphoribosyltransferase [Planctomycetota bacterium]MBI3835385.1 amidophosphoribosyltransferase [Planctomycetota bacterium]
MQPSIRHHCALFGVWGHHEAVALTHLGLYALQHRGQEAAGIVSSNGQRLLRHAGLGLVNEVFNEDNLSKIKGRAAIGHCRYSTTGSCTEENAQPLMFSFAGGQVAIAHNGNLINAALLRRHYEEIGHIFQTTSDTEVIIHLLAKPTHQEKENPLNHVLNHLQGAYSLLFLFPDRMIAVRDPLGFRPLCLGRMKNGAYVAASETKALDLIDATHLRDVEPGEIVTIDDDGLHIRHFGGERNGKGAACIFELIYFADPASTVFGDNVHLVRMAMGEQLAREAPAEGDFVVPIPNCAQCAATGYARESGIPYGRAFTTSYYTGRSFIMPTQEGRDLAVRMKLAVIKDAVAGKRLIVVEDSVVRGTTTRGKIGALRDAGAKEIHLRVASPPIRHPCYFGIDFPDQKELIAHTRSVDEIRKFLGVDSLAYLSHEGMLSSVRMASEKYCTACFSGRYPMDVTEPVEKFALERSQLKMFT